MIDLFLWGDRRVIIKATRLLCWLQLWWNIGPCTDALQEERKKERKKKKSAHAFSSITMQDNTTGFLPTVAPLGDVISRQSINPKKNNLIAISWATLDGTAVRKE